VSTNGVKSLAPNPSTTSTSSTTNSDVSTSASLSVDTKDLSSNGTPRVHSPLSDEKSSRQIIDYYDLLKRIRYDPTEIFNLRDSNIQIWKLSKLNSIGCVWRQQDIKICQPGSGTQPYTVTKVVFESYNQTETKTMTVPPSCGQIFMILGGTFVFSTTPLATLAPGTQSAGSILKMDAGTTYTIMASGGTNWLAKADLSTTSF